MDGIIDDSGELSRQMEEYKQEKRQRFLDKFSPCFVYLRHSSEEGWTALVDSETAIALKVTDGQQNADIIEEYLARRLPELAESI